jgi:flagellar hook-basal body complex protein FliE
MKGPAAGARDDMAIPALPIQNVPIQSIDPQTAVKMPTIGATAPSAAPGNLFHSVFTTAVNTVEGLQSGADQAVTRFLTGENEDVHSAVLAVQRADLSFSLFQQVRNRVISAYQEIMKTQV